MIFNAQWRDTLSRTVLPRLSAAHPDLARIAAALRNGAGVDVWTETPSDASKLAAGKTSYSLEGWRVHYASERTTLAAFNTAHGSALLGYDSQAKTALDGYLSSIPNIGSAFGAIMAKYKDAQGRLLQTTVAQADRDTLAAAIEAELQA